MNIDDYILSGAVESYVLGLADAHEVQEIEALIPQYPQLKEAIEAFELSLEQTAFAHAVTPDASVKNRLMDALAEETLVSEENDAKVIPLNNNSTSTLIANTSNKWQIMAAASILLFIVSGATNFYLYSKYNEASNQVVALLNDKNNLTASNQAIQAKYLDFYNSLAVVSDPVMKKVMLPGVKGKEDSWATVFWDTKTKDVYLLPNKLPEAPANKQYQLWALVDGKPVDAGVLSNCNGVCKLKAIPHAQAFAITLEKVGGSPAPNLSALFVLGQVTS